MEIVTLTFSPGCLSAADVARLTYGKKDIYSLNFFVEIEKIDERTKLFSPVTGISMFVDTMSPLGIKWYTTNLALGTISKVASKVMVKMFLFGIFFLADKITFPRDDNR